MIEDEERFDPSRHSLADAAKRLKQIGEKDYTSRLAEILEKHEEQDTGEMATGDVVDLPPLMFDNHEHELVLPPIEHEGVQMAKCIANICVLDGQQLRKLVREEVHRALYPSAEMANPHEHRRIEMVEENGKKWRGVLYAVEDEQSVNQSNQQ